MTAGRHASSRFNAVSCRPSSSIQLDSENQHNHGGGQHVQHRKFNATFDPSACLPRDQYKDAEGHPFSYNGDFHHWFGQLIGGKAQHLAFSECSCSVGVQILSLVFPLAHAFLIFLPLHPSDFFATTMPHERETETQPCLLQLHGLSASIRPFFLTNSATLNWPYPCWFTL